jgi:hypothetical protein
LDITQKNIAAEANDQVVGTHVRLELRDDALEQGVPGRVSPEIVPLL